MSAFVGLLFDRIAYVGTDTLVREAYQLGDESIRVRLFANKTFHVPQFKSIFAVTGCQDLGISFLRFLTNRCIGLDINSIVNIAPSEYIRDMEAEFTPPLWGTIYLYGLDTVNKRMKGYWLPVNKPDEPVTWRPFTSPSEGGSGVAMMPFVEDLEDKVLAFDSGLSDKEQQDEVEVISRLIKIQREEDEKKVVEEQLGIGGEVMITIIGLNENDNFLIQSQIPYTFPDYLIQGAQMMVNSSKR